ncbi:MAG: hypothetical protein NW215_03485 [Hyphomicrobiales bacterium]|nr:hypothetical protein [Hyphomicrobiales bacterium]
MSDPPNPSNLSRRAALRTVALAAMSVGAGGAAAALAQPRARQPAWLTVGGRVGRPNAGPVGGDTIGFFKHHGVSFDKATAFTREELLTLPQHAFDTETKVAGRGVYSGPLLADAMRAAGAETGALRLMALDGFAVELAAADRAADWMLALSLNDAPFGVGGLGPCWLMRKLAPGAPPAFEEEAEKWVWSVFYIEAMA